jgi:ArsR family transcriptional regulator, arsenate/arsenite/antimonite-responsive transcriptional repressor / arsenate reductase (thioredoxin)
VPSETLERPPLPDVFRLVGHPVRWALLSELSVSDRRVSELASALRLPQNGVSYHLARLRAKGLVTRRRSQADGRDSYYTADLDRYSELIAQAGVGLHPAVRFVQELPASDDGFDPAERVPVLFLCTGNSARSQIAEALSRHLGAHLVTPRSAGSHPKPLHPQAVKVMRERGIDISRAQSKSLEEFSSERFGYLVTLCDRVREVCPEFPGHPYAIHWSVPDPAREGTNDSETFAAFERTADELTIRIRYLLAFIDGQPRRK